jgi:hypothetical protein
MAKVGEVPRTGKIWSLKGRIFTAAPICAFATRGTD